MDSDSLLLTGNKIIMDCKSLSDADKKAFKISKREETDFLLKHDVESMLIEHVLKSVEFQLLK